MNKITEDLVKDWLPTREEDTYKNKMGHVLCVGGNENMGGAAILSASAALYAGAGLVSVASSPKNLHALHARLPEAMFVDMYDQESLSENVEKADVIVLGPGLGLSEDALDVFKTVIHTIDEKQWLILDGDGITHLVNESSTAEIPTENIILTPHPGEWQRLSGIHPPADSPEENQQKQQELEATVVLKKDRTEVYIEDDIWENTAGNPSMATGGMGDTLTGIIASLLGQYENKKEALLSAVYMHSAVADELAETYYVTLPTKIIEYLPIFMKNLQL